MKEKWGLGWLPDLQTKNCVIVALSSAFLAFGFYHVHSFSNVTEGGVLGLTLVIQHWLHVSPAFSGFVLDAFCYFLGWKTLGKGFIGYSAVSTVSFSITYKICELFPPLWPNLYEAPLLAAIVGALFVGLGAGISIRIGAAPGGDDALAMSIAHYFPHIKIQWIYLFSDFLVLGLSATYIPWKRLGYSFLTVMLSSQVIGVVQDFKLPQKKSDEQIPATEDGDVHEKNTQ